LSQLYDGTDSRAGLGTIVPAARAHQLGYGAGDIASGFIGQLRQLTESQLLKATNDCGSYPLEIAHLLFFPVTEGHGNSPCKWLSLE
jgi:hypothetical protein